MNGMEKERGEWEGLRAGRGQRRVGTASWATGRTWALAQSEVGAIEGSGQRRDIT